MAYVKATALKVLARSMVEADQGARKWVEVELQMDHYIGVDTCGELGCFRILGSYVRTVRAC